MKKKGFTLIELLAVIVILAIIALIATPAVLNIIEDSRKSAAEASARNIVSTAKTYYMSKTMQGSTPSTIDLSGTTLLYDGDRATKGYITFTDGKPSGKMYISGYCVEINIDSTVASKKVGEDECDVTIPIVYTKYIDGTPLLYDPVNNVKCETSIGSTIGTNNGCMKWYAFLDSEDSSTVNLLLDHNTTGEIAWNSDSKGTTPDTINAKLVEDVANWNAEIKSTARLISAEEINSIAPTTPNYEWSVNKYADYYLHTGNQTQYKGAVGTNKYAWLFDNTIYCNEYGCNVSCDGVFGYWTSSLKSTGYAWYVYYDGKFDISNVDYAGLRGVRPVITVSKSIFE